MNLRAVLDTNVMVSGLLWRGIPFEILKSSENGRLVMFSFVEAVAKGGLGPIPFDEIVEITERTIDFGHG